MGMSTYVIGFKEPDETWNKYKKVWDACNEAGVDIPDDVLEYFNHEAPDESGVEVELETQEYTDYAKEGFEIDVSKLPKHVSRIRFYNSW